MNEGFRPVLKESLADRLARRIRSLIEGGGYEAGDRLPPIMEMARRFQVGHPSVREALTKLESIGLIEVRHGSGVYVSGGRGVLLMAAPDYSVALTKKLLLDLVDARVVIEPESAALAARQATPEHLAEMRKLMETAGEHLDDDVRLNTVNMAFHREIARASGNVVLAQLIEVLRGLFTDEQRLILGIFGSREGDHQQHLDILEAIEARDAKAASERMRAHLHAVRGAIERWDPDDHPLG
jgi:GntR family transcriptional repressor for pyruvate dehydrogenase complex